MNKKKIIIKLRKLFNIFIKNGFDSVLIFGSFMYSKDFNDIDILIIKENISPKDFINLLELMKKIQKNNTEFNIGYHTKYLINDDRIKIRIDLVSGDLKEILPSFYNNLIRSNNYKVINGKFNQNIFLQNTTIEIKKSIDDYLIKKEDYDLFKFLINHICDFYKLEVLDKKFNLKRLDKYIKINKILKKIYLCGKIENKKEFEKEYFLLVNILKKN